jgi:2-iminobutanoate/2-iminopropanoate deaminase
MPFWIRFGSPNPMHEAIETRNAPEPRGHYSQAVRMGSFLFVSGQLPLVRDGKLIDGTVAEECAQALENVRAIVEAADGTIADIVQCTIYVSDISHWTEVDGIYGAFFAEVPVLPARAVVPVKDLHYGAHIEIQAIAVLNRA